MLIPLDTLHPLFIADSMRLVHEMFLRYQAFNYSHKCATDISRQVSFVHDEKFSYLPHEIQLLCCTQREFEVLNRRLHKYPSGKHTISHLVVLPEEVVEIVSDIHCKILSTCPNTNHKALKQHYYGITRYKVCNIFKHCLHCNKAKTHPAPAAL